MKIENWRREDKLAFVFVSCGPFARSCRAEVAIESLIKVGGWKGNVYLITDSPHCFDLDALCVAAGSDRIYLKTVESFSHRLESILQFDRSDRRSLGVPKLKYVPKVRMRSKALKTRVFEFVHDAIEVVVFSDCDMVVSGRRHMPDFLGFCVDWKDKVGLTLRGASIILENGQVSKNSRIHTGLFIAHRQHSATALAEWRTRMYEEKSWLKDPFDRTRYFDAFLAHSDKTPNPLSVHELPDHFEGFLNFDRDQPLFVHISNGRMANISKRKIESFLESLNLKSYPKNGYVPPSFLTWFSDLFYSGAFPFKGKYKVEYLWRFFS